jgi:hypothetical protein
MCVCVRVCVRVCLYVCMYARVYATYHAEIEHTVNVIGAIGRVRDKHIKFWAPNFYMYI